MLWALIALLNLQYWCKDEEEKERLKKVYANNENKYQEELRKKYNPDNIFKNANAETTKEETALVEFKKEKWFEKIVLFIKNLFKKTNKWYGLMLELQMI